MATVASFFQRHGISVNVSDPLVWAERSNLGNIAAIIDSYDHEIKADGGFFKATIGLSTTRAAVDDWFINGVGRHIEVSSAGLATVFEGYVDSVTLTYGGLELQRGPLREVLNSADLVFSTIDSTAEPPATGDRRRLSDINGSYTNDTESQAMYGIWRKVLSTGGISEDSDPDLIVDSRIADDRIPTTSQRFRTGATKGASLKLNVEGYYRWLDYPYNHLTGGDVAISTKMQAVLTADPNAIISTNYDYITANTYQVSQYEDKDRKAWTVLGDLVEYGDANNLRYTLGLYEDRIAYYAGMTEDIDYVQRMGSDTQRVETEQGGFVYPWDVRPAKWLFYADVLTGLDEPVTLAERREDPRYEFIETVRYTAPWGLAHNGEKQGTAKQALQKFGLTGVGG
jgi:hypothetical protein